jgi:hypothetical protein
VPFVEARLHAGGHGGGFRVELRLDVVPGDEVLVAREGGGDVRHGPERLHEPRMIEAPETERLERPAQLPVDPVQGHVRHVVEQGARPVGRQPPARRPARLHEHVLDAVRRPGEARPRERRREARLQRGEVLPVAVDDAEDARIALLSGDLDAGPHRRASRGGVLQAADEDTAVQPVHRGWDAEEREEMGGALLPSR